MRGNRYDTLFGRYAFGRSKSALSFAPEFGLISDYGFLLRANPFAIVIRSSKKELAASVFLGDDQSDYKGLGQSARDAYQRHAERQIDYCNPSSPRRNTTSQVHYATVFRWD